METNLQIKILSISVIICLLLVLTLGSYTWHLNQKLDAPTPSESASPTDASPLQGSFMSPPVAAWSNSPLFSGSTFDFNKSFEELQQDILSFQQSMLGNMLSPGHLSTGSIMATPDIAMAEDIENYLITITIPEGQEIDISTNYENGRLTISGTSSTEKSSTSSSLFSQSSHSSQFSRSFWLPNVAHGAADLDIQQSDKKITITIPKVG